MQSIINLLKAIPERVWIKLSIAVAISIVTATFGLTISTVFSSDIELEIANSKLVLSKQIAEAKQLNSDSEKSLILISQTLQQSQQTNKELREKIKQLKSLPCAFKNQKIREIEQTINQVAEPETDKNLQEIEEIKSELEHNTESLEKLTEELVDHETK